MKGMLLKDLFLMRRNARYVLSIMIVYLVIGTMLADVTMTLGVVTLVCVMLALTLFSHDDLAKWDTYVSTLPISRSEIVTARYLAGLLLLVMGVATSFVMWGVLAALGMQGDTSPAAVLAGIGGTAGVGLLIMSAMFPLCYKLGVEKARISLMLIFLLPVAGFTLIGRLGIPMPSEQTVIRLLQLSVLIIPLIFIASWRISCSLRRKKD